MNAPLERSKCLKFFHIQLFHDGGTYHTETSPLTPSVDWFPYYRDFRHERGNVGLR